MGAPEKSAQGHFQHAGLTIEPVEIRYAFRNQLASFAASIPRYHNARSTDNSPTPPRVQGTAVETARRPLPSKRLTSSGDDAEDTDNSNSDDSVNNDDSNNDDNASSFSKPNKLTVHLTALLRDISDRKYLPKTQEANAIPPHKLVEHILLSHGADPVLATRVQTIVSHVSYTTECKDPSAVRRLIGEEGYVELAIVQDADRLDALGAKLERLDGMMKTGTGRAMARVRTERLVEFRRWWGEEMGDVHG
ncbi:hypothetical protein BDW71DRAFT_207867 [Aspergillus fruticulosus]